MRLNSKSFPLISALFALICLVQLPLLILWNGITPIVGVLLLGWSLVACAVLVWLVGRATHTLTGENARLTAEIQALKADTVRLKSERARYATIFQRSPLAIALLTPDDRTMVDVNPTALALLGTTTHTDATLLGTWAMIPDRKRVMSLFNENGIVRNVEMPLRSASGQTINTLAQIEAVTIDDRLYKLVFAFDVKEYRQTQEQLSQFRRDLHAIARAFPDLYFRIDADGKFCDYMSGTVPALGLTPEVFLGRTIQEVLPSDAAQILLNGIHSLRGEHPVKVATVEYQLKLNRQRQHFEVRMVLEEDGTILAIARDITTRKEQANRLAESEALFRQLTVNINEVLFIRDLEQQKLIYMSDLFFNIWGFGDKEAMMTSASLTRDVHPEDIPRVQELVRQQKRGESGDIEYRIVHPKTGEIRWLRTRNVPIKNSEDVVYRVAVLSEDVTERKRSEETLRQNESKFRTLAETMPAGVSIIRVNEVLFVNSELERLTGYNHEELAAMNFLKVVNHDDYDVDRQWITARLTQSESERRGFQPPSVQRIQTKDGIERWIQFATNVIEMPDGPALLVVGLDVTALQLASEALRQREEEFRAFVENSPDFIARFDRNLRFLYVNPTLLDRAGVSSEVYLGRTTREISETYHLYDHIENFADTIDMWETILWKVIETGEEETIEDIHYISNSVTYLETRFVPEYSKDGTVETVLAITRDITESKRAEIERRENELMLRQFAENMNEIMVVRDAGTHKPIYISPAFEEIWGRPSAPMLENPTIYEHDVLDDGNLVIRERSPKQYEIPTDITYRIRRPDGETRWLRSRTFPIRNDRGEIYRVGGLVEDFTQHKMIEDALRENQAVFDQMANNISEVLFVTDVETNKVIYITPSCEQLWGYTQEQIMENSYVLVNSVHPDDLPRMGEQYGTRTYGYSAEYRIIRQTDGEIRWVRSRVFPIKNEHGEVYRITGLVEDITERMKIEEDAHERERLALELEKQRSLNRLINHFVAMVSHEFRTPLAVILSSGRMLQDYAERMAEERRQHHLNKMVDQTIYMTQLMDEVLTYQSIESRKSEFHPERINLIAYAQELVDESHLDRENPRITFTSSGDLDAVQMDKKLLRQIITNLLSNAQKYSDHAPVEFHIERKKNMVNMTIRDYGIGIPEIYHPYVFEPFRRAENVGTRRGNGLGLAIVKMSVEAHQGHINFDTQPDEGTTFIVQLPAVPPAQDETAEARQVAKRR